MINKPTKRGTGNIIDYILYALLDTPVMGMVPAGTGNIEGSTM